MANIVITGTSRGIGLGLVRSFLQRGHKVEACCRNPDGARDLWELESDYASRLTLRELDVSEEASIQTLCDSISDIDILVNNAGVMNDPGGLLELDTERFLYCLQVNTLGPMLMTRSLLPMLQKRQGCVANITSQMGSIADNSSGRYYGYRMSKAALNMFNKSLAIDFPEVRSVVLHPGWVKTDMGGGQAPLDIFKSSESLAEIILNLQNGQSGRFLSYDGREIPW